MSTARRLEVIKDLIKFPSFRFGRRFTFYTSVFISVVGRLMIMSTSNNYVLFSISAVVGSLTSISLFQAPLIIAMETSEP